jgi:hypothetical protein
MLLERLMMLRSERCQILREQLPMTYDSATMATSDRAQQNASRSMRVELELISLTEHGQRYRVTFVGETLVEGRRNPIFDACRALLVQGMTGRLEVWRRGKTDADMQLDIEKGAAFAVRETDTESLRVVPWRPRPAVTTPDAVLYRRAQPPAATDASPVGMPTPEASPAHAWCVQLARTQGSTAPVACDSEFTPGAEPIFDVEPVKSNSTAEQEPRGASGRVLAECAPCRRTLLGAIAANQIAQEV